MKKKTDKSENEYKGSVGILIQTQDNFYDTEMPAVLREFEQHDEKRIELTKDFFIEFCNTQSSIGPHISASNERLLESFQKIDAKSDLNLFIEMNRPSGSRPRAQDEEGGISTTPSITTNPTPKVKDEPKTKPSVSDKKKKGKEEHNHNNNTPVNSPGVPPPSDLPPPPPSNPPPPLPTGSTNRPPPRNSSIPREDQFIALYDYVAKEEGEIDMVEGEIITLLEKDDDSGWWIGRNQNGLEGSFPSNFVEPVEIIEINKEYKVTFNYDAEDEGELNITEGEILMVYTETDGWYYGRNSKGEEGNFPSNYVEPK